MYLLTQFHCPSRRRLKGPPSHSRTISPFAEKVGAAWIGWPGCARDAIGQNINVSRESQILVLAHFLGLPLIPIKQHFLAILGHSVLLRALVIEAHHVAGVFRREEL
jgi:hypothetical protein